MSDRQSIIMAAILKVHEDDYDKSGAPSLKAVNAIIKEDAPDAKKATKAELAKIWDQVTEDFKVSEKQDEEAAAEFEPVQEYEITVTDVRYNTVPVFVHGRGMANFTVGEKQKVSKEVLDALLNSDVEFTKEGTE